jgi:two-component system, chemotaxis family, response regulator WspF
LKIAIVNDLPLAVESLRRIVTLEGGHEVIWVAENGRIAMEKCAGKIPDLILMDLIMPVMNGVEATRLIMKLSPCPILVVTATVTSNSALVFEAMGAGALDVMATPIQGKEVYPVEGRELLKKIDQIAKITAPRAQPAARRRAIPAGNSMAPYESGPCLIVIGSSTGGPQALLGILRELPGDFAAAMVVVQHMDEQFTSGLADWLNGHVKPQVRVLRERDRPEPGVVLIASTNNHLVMRADKTFTYTVEPKNNFYHPSVDVFFNSVALYWRHDCIAVILTGMGRDGAEGLLALRDKGFLTIAQDRQSSVVYGMPKAAIELEAAREILPISQIGQKIKNALATGKGKQHGRM